MHIPCRSAYPIRAIAALSQRLSSPAARGEDVSPDTPKTGYRRPGEIPFPASAPYSPQMATLGKMLFFDTRLSGAQNLSCASCHNLSFGYQGPLPGAIGSANTPLARTAPTALNAAIFRSSSGMVAPRA